MILQINFVCNVSVPCGLVDHQREATFTSFRNFFFSLQEFIFFHSVWMYVGLLFNIHSSAVLHTLSHSHIISFYSLISVIK